jgi:hypothetical protein
MKSFIYGHIHPWWIKITLSLKFQIQSSKLRLYGHAQAIFKMKLMKKVMWHKVLPIV